MASHFISTCWICNQAIPFEDCRVDEYGKGVHAKCYTAMLAHPNGKSIGEKEKRSWELCALATKEQDPHKLFTLVQEINALLEEREQINPGHLPANPPDD